MQELHPTKLMPSNIAFFLYFLSEFPGTNSDCVLYAKYTIDQSQYCNLKSSTFLLQDWQVNFFPLLQQSEKMNFFSKQIIQTLFQNMEGKQIQINSEMSIWGVSGIFTIVQWNH